MKTSRLLSFILVFILLLSVLIFLPGCIDNAIEDTAKEYKSNVDKAKDVSVDVDFKAVAVAQEAYRVENGSYTSNIEDLKDLGEISSRVTIVEASDDSFKLKVEKDGKTSYYEK